MGKERKENKEHKKHDLRKSSFIKNSS